MLRKTSRTRELLLRRQHQLDTRPAQAFKDQRASVCAAETLLQCCSTILTQLRRHDMTFSQIENCVITPDMTWGRDISSNRAL